MQENEKILAELIIEIQRKFEEDAFYDEDGRECFGSVKNIKNIFEMDRTPNALNEKYAFPVCEDKETVCGINRGVYKNDNSDDKWSVFWFLRKRTTGYSYCLPMDLYYKIVKNWHCKEE